MHAVNIDSIYYAGLPQLEMSWILYYFVEIFNHENVMDLLKDFKIQLTCDAGFNTPEISNYIQKL